MKKIIQRAISLLLACVFVILLLPVIAPVKVKAATQNQKNIVARANYFYDTTWVCQKTIYGWRDEYTFTEGETYRLPYAQPVNSGKFIGYGVTLEDFLDAAADGSSVFYSQQSEYNGWTSTYYGTDCAAFVAMCWGTVRQDCSTLPYYSTNIGVASTANVSKIELGDALDSTSVGHVVLVTDLTYDDSGDLTQIEITEQTPPQLKRTYYTPSELVEKYGDDFYIYRYYGEVPEAPERGYHTTCEDMASHCDIQITDDTPIMSQPCASSVDATSVQLGTAMAGDSHVATRLYVNTVGELWYRVALSEDEVGYVAAANTSYQGQILDDITLTDATAPSAHVRGKTFSVNGTINAVNNRIPTASVYIYEGFGITDTPKTGDSDTVSSNSYTLKSSTIDYNTSFGNLSTGPHTYVIAADYENYYATGADTYEKNTGTVTLMESYFMVVSSSVSQTTCSHSYTTTEVYQQSCTSNGLTVTSCATCGLVEQTSVDALGHSYGEWTVDVDATCTADGSRSSTCATCGYIRTEAIAATGHSYEAVSFGADCQTYAHTTHICASCGDSYNTYPEESMSDWQTELPEVSADLIETKQQYRFSTYETVTSELAELEGYTLLDSAWTAGESGIVYYVESWPSGFDQTSELYDQYNNIDSKITASETDSTKTVIDSDAVVGYLYYHWCYSDSYYSQAQQNGNYTVFHAYYSETDPSNYTCDTSDYSYKTSDACCSNSNWFFVAEVKGQRYTDYTKIYTHERWTDWSDWSDEAVEASDICQVEERTVYRYVSAAYGDHDYQDGVCTVCGDVVEVETVIPTLKPSYPTVSFEGKIQINIYYTVEDLGTVGLEDMGLLTWKTPKSEATVDNADAVIPGAVASGESYIVHTEGIAAKNLGDTVYFKIYAKLSDGSYVYTDMYSTSPKTYAYGLLSKESADEHIKALCVAMLNYGAEAQKYFGYKHYDLINADLTEEQQALVQAYDGAMMDSVVAAAEDKTTNFVRSTEAFTKLYPTVSFEGAFSINYYFANSLPADDGMTMYYWEAEDYEAAQVLSAENATGTVQMTLDGTQYWGEVANIAAKDMDSTVYVAGVYSSDGVAYTTGVIAYSLGSYCESIAADATNDAQTLASMTAVYGYYAELYFDYLYG